MSDEIDADEVRRALESYKHFHPDSDVGKLMYAARAWLAGREKPQAASIADEMNTDELREHVTRCSEMHNPAEMRAATAAARLDGLRTALAIAEKVWREDGQARIPDAMNEIRAEIAKGEP